MPESDVRDLYPITYPNSTQEWLGGYHKDGFHPVCLHDRLKNGRYEIRQKLGYGGYSTVWLAIDHRLHRWVSIKVLVADDKRGSREIQNMRSITERTKNKRGSQRLCKLLDAFVVNGPNGSHHCLVMDLVGPSLRTILNLKQGKQNGHFRFETILKMSKELLESVALMHRAGYGHGDLNLGNVAFSANKLSDLNEDDLFDCLGWPIAEDLIRLDRKPLEICMPREMTMSAHWMDWKEEVWAEDDREGLQIIDFGESFGQGVHLADPAMPPDLRVPELILTGKMDNRGDLWHVGILIFCLIFGHSPFGCRHCEDAYLVSQMENFFGKVPTCWHQKWLEMQTAGRKMESRPQSQDFRSDAELDWYFGTKLSDARLKRFHPVIKGLTRWLPSDRLSANSALALLQPSKPGAQNPHRGSQARRK